MGGVAAVLSGCGDEDMAPFAFSILHVRAFCMLGEYGGCGLVAFNQLSQALWSAWDMDRKNSVLHKRLP
jgi:hypothetical protein